MEMQNFKIKLEFNIEEMNMIFEFLGTIPYDRVWGLMGNLKEQVDKQLIPPEDFDVSGQETDHPL
jgi:hypothetical protein